jgi:hypothetical protein
VRDTEACENNRRPHDARTADTNHGPGEFERGLRQAYATPWGYCNILGQAHVPKLVAAATDDDGSVRSAKERKENTTVTSARAKAAGGAFTFLLLTNRSFIAL